MNGMIRRAVRIKFYDRYRSRLIGEVRSSRFLTVRRSSSRNSRFCSTSTTTDNGENSNRYLRIHRHRQLSSLQLVSLAAQKVQAVMEGQPWVNENSDNSSTLTQAQEHPQSELKVPEDQRRLRRLRRRSARVLDANHIVDHNDIDPEVKEQPPTIPSIDPNGIYILQVWGHTSHQCGGAGIGLVLQDATAGKDVWSCRIYCRGDRTIFESDYTAIIMGLDYCWSVLNVRKIIVQSSNRPIVRQIHGIYKARSSLEQLNNLTLTIGKQFINFYTQFIPADESTDAKSLAHTALATRKSINVLDHPDWLVAEKDPMQNIDFKKKKKLCRWRPPDHPAMSCKIDSTRTYLVRFDGGSRENCIGLGMVMYDGSQEVWSGWKYHQHHASNNVAEYLALLYGLKAALSLGVKKLVLEGDSLLVIDQLNGRRHAKEDILQTFKDTALQYTLLFEHVEIRHVYRKYNTRADWLTKFAMDNAESGGFICLDDHGDDEELVRTVRATAFVA